MLNIGICSDLRMCVTFLKLCLYFRIELRYKIGDSRPLAGYSSNMISGCLSKSLMLHKSKSILFRTICPPLGELDELIV
jgi:hypothetical protein